MGFGRVLRTGLSSLRDRAAARLAATRVNPSRCEHIGGIYLGYDADEDAMRRHCLRCKRPFLERYKPE